jgi:hypothetical protein
LGAGDDQDDRPASGDVDFGQLVHLAEALEVADVEAVDRHEMAWCGAVVTEPERLAVTGGVGGQASGRRGDRRGPGDTLGTTIAPEPIVSSLVDACSEVAHRASKDRVSTLVGDAA